MDKTDQLAVIVDYLICVLLASADHLDLPISHLDQIRAELAELPKFGTE